MSREVRVKEAVRDFRPGLYRHYKGGLYTALALVTHHEMRDPMVLYVSHTYGGMNVRPLVGWAGDADGWSDEVTPNDHELSWHKARKGTQPRFAFIGDLPSNTPIEERL